MSEHSKHCIGIDLGTTNSCLALINESPSGKIVPKVLEITRTVPIYGSNKFESKKSPTLPSCVYYREEENYKPYVGDFAKSQYYLRPHLTVKSVKSSMGSDKIPGLSDDVPDHTPAQVSARILSHMMTAVKRTFRQDITDVVITVPANFDSIMCQATREAAKIAGIAVSEDDGSERTVLLSEPNAVLYDLINQIHNGEISDEIIDLSKKSNILVFDIGGGTLDVTIHEVQRRDDCPDVLKVNEIATNRYTLLGGDDFDKLIAESMFNRYVEKYNNHPQVVSLLRAKKNEVMSQFISYAEDLKKDVNETHSETDINAVDTLDNNTGNLWDDYTDDGFTVGGHIQGTNYSYDDTFTEEELEEILIPLMGKGLKYDDYKNLDNITDTSNIIYPVLDALKKASNKLNTQNFKIDAVVLNGGMSRFYMVVDRLREFFGFEPISILDPDQAVARGAAIFHYYLHKHAEIKDEMIRVPNAELTATTNLSNDVLLRHNIGIEFSNPILNDSLYLGLQGGAVEEIVKTGQTLPFDSAIYKGFKIPVYKSRIDIPIMVRNVDNSYKCIAKSSIDLGKSYDKDEMYLSFSIHMGTDKIILMKAFVSSDLEGKDIKQTIDAKIVIDNEAGRAKAAKIIPRSGTVLNPNNEIESLKQICEALLKSGRYADHKKHKELSRRTREQVASITAAKNFNDFIPLLLKELSSNDNQLFRLRMFIIARKTIELWNNEQKRMLEKACMNQLYGLLNGFSFYTKGNADSANNQALYTLGYIASERSVNKIRALKTNTKYNVPLIFCFAVNDKYGINDLVEIFTNDAKARIIGKSSTYQHSAYYIGYALRKDKNVEHRVDYTSVVNLLISALESQKLNQAEVNVTLTALGWICNQTDSVTYPVDSELAQKAEEAIYNVGQIYPSEIASKEIKAISIALKLIQGFVITVEEEEYLLSKVNKLLNGEKSD